METEVKTLETIEQLFSQIGRFSDGMDLASEMNGLLDKLEDTRKQVKEKLIELEVLEMLAFTSNHPTVVSQRNQLFSVTRLCHSQEINEFIKMEEGKAEPTNGLSPYNIAMNNDGNRKKMTIKDRLYYIYNNIHSRINRRNYTKKQYNKLEEAKVAEKRGF